MTLGGCGVGVQACSPLHNPSWSSSLRRTPRSAATFSAFPAVYHNSLFAAFLSFHAIFIYFLHRHRPRVCSRCAFLTISQKYNTSISSSRCLLMIPILLPLTDVLLTLIFRPVLPGQFLRTDRQRTVNGRTWTLLVRMLTWIRIHIRPSTLYFMICTNRWRSVLCTLGCCICG